MTSEPDRRGVLRPLTRYDRGYYLAAAAGWLTFHALPLLPGLLGKAYFDALAEPGRSWLSVPVIVVLIGSVGLTRLLVVLAATMSGARWQYALRSLVQRNVLARILRRPGAAALPATESPGHAISTLRDDSDAIAMLGDWIFDAISAAVFGVAGLAIMLSVDVWVTLLVVVPLVALIAVARRLRGRIEAARASSRSASADVTAVIADLVGGVVAIKSAGKDAAALRRLRLASAQRRRAVLGDEALSALNDAVFSAIAGVGGVLILAVSIGRMRAGDFSVGDFVLFASYLLQVSEYTGFLGYLTRSRNQADVSFDRSATLAGCEARQLLDHHPLHLTGDVPRTAPWPHQSTEPLHELTLQGLPVHGLDGLLDLRIGAGDLVVVCGPIGAGKTTFVHRLLGLLPSTGGVVRWNGSLVEDLAGWMVAPRVGYLPQQPNLLPTTMRDNILLGRPSAPGALERAVDTAALTVDLATLPAGLDSEVGARGVMLSGGQRQRTALARALVCAPSLLVLDDVCSSLDSVTARSIYNAVLAARTDGVAILMVSNDHNLLRIADTIVLLGDGQPVVANGYAALDDSDYFRTLRQEPSWTPTTAP